MTITDHCKSCGTPIRLEGDKWVHYRDNGCKAQPAVGKMHLRNVLDDSYRRVAAPAKTFTGIGGSVTLGWWHVGGSKTKDCFNLDEDVSGDNVGGRMKLDKLRPIFSGEKATYCENRLRIDSSPSGDYVIIRAGDALSHIYRSVTFPREVVGEMLAYVLDEPAKAYSAGIATS